VRNHTSVTRRCATGCSSYMVSARWVTGPFWGTSCTASQHIFLVHSLHILALYHGLLDCQTRNPGILCLGTVKVFVCWTDHLGGKTACCCGRHFTTGTSQYFTVCCRMLANAWLTLLTPNVAITALSVHTEYCT
jgi:hypothetical protein